MLERAPIRAGAIMLLSQSASAIPSCLTMTKFFGFGPSSYLFASIMAAAVVSALIGAVAFSTLRIEGSKGGVVSALVGAGCSIVSFPIGYSLGVSYDLLTVGADNSGTWLGSLLAILILTIGGVAITTLCIPYLCGAIAGYAIWNLKVGNDDRASLDGS